MKNATNYQKALLQVALIAIISTSQLSATRLGSLAEKLIFAETDLKYDHIMPDKKSEQKDKKFKASPTTQQLGAAQSKSSLALAGRMMTGNHSIMFPRVTDRFSLRNY